MSAPHTKATPQARHLKACEAVVRYAAPIMRLPVDPAAMSREDRLIDRAKKALARRLASSNVLIDGPGTLRDFLILELADEAREVFYVVFLDSQNRVISFELMFVGTLAQTSVYPREVLRRALELNAAAVILAHNHPSGHLEPSQEDQNITDLLVRALKLVNIRVLDHFIVAGALRPLSFAERGLL